MTLRLTSNSWMQVFGLQKKPVPKPPKVKASSTSTTPAPQRTEAEDEEVPHADTARTAEDPEPTQVVAHEEL
jgi:hypothetical protein